MKRKKEQIQIEKLRHDWQQLDDLAGNQSISAIEVKQQLAIYQEKQKKVFYKELKIFLVTAICILSFFIVSFVQAPVLFIVIEICALIIGPIVYFVLVKRKKKEGKALL